MRVGSLCQGIGGADLALEAHGHTVAWGAELDPAPASVCAHHWPDVPNHGDITTIDWDAVEPVDILSAGYPCQPFSTAGRRQGTNDDRHLWPAVRHAVASLRPRYVFLENVRGHLSLGAAIVVADLAALGYVSTWGLLGSSDVGGCHRRIRWWLVAADPTRRSRQDGSVSGGASRLDVGPVAGAGGGDRGGNTASGVRVVGGTASELAAVDLLPTPVASDGRRASTTYGRGNPSLIGALLPTPRTSDSNGAGAHGSGGPDLRSAVALLPTSTVNDSRGGRNATSARKEGSQHHDGWTLCDVAYADTFDRYAAAVERWAVLLGVEPPAPTFLSPLRKKLERGPQLNPAFVEWMMGYPAGWITDLDLTRTAQLKALGNAQQPQVAYQAWRLLTGRLESEAVAA